MQLQPVHPRNPAPKAQVPGLGTSNPLSTCIYTKYKGKEKNRLEFISLSDSIVISWELLMGFAGDNPLLCLLSCSSLIRGTAGSGLSPVTPSCWVQASSSPWAEENYPLATLSVFGFSPGPGPNCSHPRASALSNLLDTRQFKILGPNINREIMVTCQIFPKNESI